MSPIQIMAACRSRQSFFSLSSAGLMPHCDPVRIFSRYEATAEKACGACQVRRQDVGCSGGGG